MKNVVLHLLRESGLLLDSHGILRRDFPLAASCAQSMSSAARCIIQHAMALPEFLLAIIVSFKGLTQKMKMKSGSL